MMLQQGLFGSLDCTKINSPNECLVGREVDRVSRDLPSNREGQASKEPPEAVLPNDADQGLDCTLAVVVHLHLGLDQLHRGAHESLKLKFEQFQPVC